LSEELERLKPEERRRVYRILRPEVSARPDGTLEARGILGENLQVGSEDGRAVCDPELALWCTSNPANRTELAFRAVLTEGGTERLELEATYNSNQRRASETPYGSAEKSRI
jgi:hypothetical protein